MFFILGLILFSLAIGAIAWACSGNSSYNRDRSMTAGYVGAGISGLVCFILLVIIWASSYDTYLSMRAFYRGTCEQYVGAVNIYGDWAVIDIEDAAWTDFKYQGYQENIADFIKTLRRQVTVYNVRLIKKRAMKENLVFNWLIVAPDKDMLVMKMRDKMFPEPEEVEKEE